MYLKMNQKPYKNIMFRYKDAKTTQTQYAEKMEKEAYAKDEKEAQASKSKS